MNKLKCIPVTNAPSVREKCTDVAISINWTNEPVPSKAGKTGLGSEFHALISFWNSNLIAINDDIRVVQGQMMPLEEALLNWLLLELGAISALWVSREYGINRKAQLRYKKKKILCHLSQSQSISNSSYFDSSEFTNFKSGKILTFLKQFFLH